MTTHLVRRHGSVALAVSGRLDMTSAAGVEEDLGSLIDAGERRVALDLTAVDYLSSAGLRAVLIAAKRLRQLEGALVVVGPTGNVKEVLDLSGLSGVLDVYPDETSLHAARPDWS